jgi:polysaccharide pyruvyl transferase WcaK-like protein
VVRVFIGHNFFGAGNFGDDLMLAGFLRHVAARGIDAEFVACTPWARESQMRRFPSVTWLDDADETRNRALREADLWLGLGDTPFQLDSGPWFLDHLERETRRCASLAKPMYFLGVGCESVEAALDARAREVLSAARIIWTRDKLSAQLLRTQATGAAVEEGADLAHLVFDRAASSEDVEAGSLGLLLAFERQEQLNVVALERFIEEAREWRRVRWLVLEARFLPYFEKWNLNALSEAPRRRLDVMEIDYSTSSIDDFLAAFGAPEVLFSSRYHGALAAAWRGSRIVIVPRSSKLSALADQFGLASADAATSFAFGPQAIAASRAVSASALHSARRLAEAMCDAFWTVVRA